MSKTSINLTGGTPLTILAGVPNSVAEKLGQRLGNRYKRNDGHPKRFFLTITGGPNGGTYNKHTLETSFDNIAHLIQNKYTKSEGAGKFNPSHISIVYLSPQTESEENLLLSYFYIFCRCVPIRWQPNDWNEESFGIMEKLFIKEIDSMSTWCDEMKSSCFNLPIRNFFLAKDISLEAHCLERIKTQNKLLPIDTKVINFFNCKDISKCRDCKRINRKIPRDSRELCFVPGAEHGRTRISDNPGRMTQGLLESIFRFGQPIEQGAQCDVQFEGGRSLRGMSFFDAEKGKPHIVSNQKNHYVNIYINDAIRFPESEVKNDKKKRSQ